jgi:hypothetical protein
MRTGPQLGNFAQNRVGKLQDNALAKGTTLPFALTISKETPLTESLSMKSSVDS